MKEGNEEISKVDWTFLLRFHAIFAVAVAISLTQCHEYGPTVLLLVIGWNLGFAVFSKGHVYRMWRFCAIQSMFQIFPDWFLVTSLGALHFPPNGVWRIGGAVSCYMAGMWSIPTFLIMLSSTAAVHPFWKYFLAAIVSLTIFGAAEFLLYYLDLWHCTDAVKQRLFGHVAVYILPAEAILGPTILYAYRATNSEGLLSQIVGAFATMLLYTGALAIAYLLIEQ